ncbi:unnamed protein product [Symbiodinium natans]|uniref:Uncharacterized protein n=1 Tax=Symbiodinium natans TaxID=878477 RepID=A0A812QA95_9DINO|nr:unnamed protein product [Symbiodinium natans]
MRKADSKEVPGESMSGLRDLGLGEFVTNDGHLSAVPRTSSPPAPAWSYWS